ncbi:hypothetical protein STPYR_11521 [uncultured Stenotrophomonas sp.]|uniref:Transmembrane protein n=1 Tax=uncultured Stenotrophomonas sp. TaxID=165438 RepID=A0A1Y5Q2W4_9GAMM|nr:hypothetical protein STPYR_11521 [uncultured Stenotrophomonas sp.]
MHPHDTSRRAAIRSASGNVQAGPLRAGWHQWLVALLLLTVIAAALAVVGGHGTGAGNTPQLSATLPATLDDCPPAPLQPSLHQPGISEADGENGRSQRMTDSAPAPWPACTTRNGTALAVPTPSVTPALGQPYRTPPAHAPPARRHG